MEALDIHWMPRVIAAFIPALKPLDFEGFRVDSCARKQRFADVLSGRQQLDLGHRHSLPTIT